MKTKLTKADKDKVFRLAHEPFAWMHFYYNPRDGYWWAAPCDPRRKTMLTNTCRASGATPDGTLERAKGFIEVSDEHE